MLKHRHMKRYVNILSLTATVALLPLLAGCGKNHDNTAEQAQVQSTKRERNSIKEGNAQYAEQHYADAEISYKKALEENPDNATAQFNLASAYLKQRGNDIANKADSLVRTADAMLAKVASQPDVKLAESSFYDRGNIAYKAEDYASAIEMYKNALRRNPDNNQARENLRLAQLKKQEQDQQNQDQNKDKQDQNQDQNKDHNQDQQQNQDQQDNKQDQDKDKDKDQNQQNSPDQNKDQQQQQKQQQGGLSDASAQQILKAMEDKENGTRQKVELMKQGEEKRANRRTTDKPW